MTEFRVERYARQRAKFKHLIEEFRLETFKEGNESLSYEKYDPDYADLETWMVFADNKLISISAVESSHYTGDSHIAARVCRYHILKPWRFTHCGLMMADSQIEWARNEGFQILYCTHDVANKAINALYQRKKQMTDPAFKKWTNTEWYINLQLEKDFLFKVSPKTDFLQFVYSINLNDKEFKWKPKKNIVWYEHNGENIKPDYVLEIGKVVH